MTFEEWKQMAEEMEPMLRQTQEITRKYMGKTNCVLLFAGPNCIDVSWTDKDSGASYESNAWGEERLQHCNRKKSPTGRASE